MMNKVPEELAKKLMELRGASSESTASKLFEEVKKMFVQQVLKDYPHPAITEEYITALVTLAKYEEVNIRERVADRILEYDLDKLLHKLED